jgi:hypothetical protein
MSEKFTYCQLTAERVELPDIAAVHALLATGQDAWLQTTSAVWVRHGTGGWTRVSGSGDDWRALPPLDAEVVLGSGRSATLRHRGKDWLWVEFAQSEGETERRVDRDFVGNFSMSLLDPRARVKVVAQLRYATYWVRKSEGDGAEQIDVWRPKAARFLGFDQCDADS